MKKLYTNPDMDIRVFEAENIVTASGQKAGDIMDAAYKNDAGITGGFKKIGIGEMKEVDWTF